ncbi:MAG: hypothetical protein WAV51_00150 [Microgenomates group bacterium]
MKALKVVGLVIVAKKEGGKEEFFQIVSVSTREDWCALMVKWKNNAWGKDTCAIVDRDDMVWIDCKGISKPYDVRVFTEDDRWNRHLPESFYEFSVLPVNPCFLTERMTEMLRMINRELENLIIAYPRIQSDLPSKDIKDLHTFCLNYASNLDLIKQQIASLEGLSTIQETES